MNIILFILGLSLLILAHEAGHFFAAKKFKLLVEEFGFGFPPRLLKKKKGDTLYTLNALPLGGFVKIHGEYKTEDPAQIKEKSFWALPPFKRIIIVAAGIFINFIIGWALLFMVYFVGSASYVAVTAISENSPAYVAGIKVGDRMSDFKKVESFIGFVSQNKGKETILNIERDGKEINLKVIPRENPPAGEGSLGVTLIDTGIPKSGFFGSIYGSLKSTLFIMKSIYQNLYNLVFGAFTGKSVFKDLVGPVGIFQVANQTAKFGFVYLLQLIALISLNLAALNSLPFPALDGGRILFILIEKLKGSPIKKEREAIINAIGFAVLFLLMIAITIKDVLKIF